MRKKNFNRKNYYIKSKLITRKFSFSKPRFISDKESQAIDLWREQKESVEYRHLHSTRVNYNGLLEAKNKNITTFCRNRFQFLNDSEKENVKTIVINNNTMQRNLEQQIANLDINKPEGENLRHTLQHTILRSKLEHSHQIETLVCKSTLRFHQEGGYTKSETSYYINSYESRVNQLVKLLEKDDYLFNKEKEFFNKFMSSLELPVESSIESEDANSNKTIKLEDQQKTNELTLETSTSNVNNGSDSDYNLTKGTEQSSANKGSLVEDFADVSTEPIDIIDPDS